ncbi:hypothetical protein FRC12_019608 [Ceratobasidium sp. 428]|nr:hypothetical protein FRC12_019608 [Ceratobasidium sp. 428]
MRYYVVQWVYTNFTQLLFVCAVAGAASLAVALVARIFVPGGGYARDAISALGLLKNLVRLATTRTIDFPQSPSSRPLSPDPTVTSATFSPSPTLESLQQSCLDASLALHSSYAYSAFELRVGRVPVSHIRPLLATVGRMREELAWGVVRAGVHTQGPQGFPFSVNKAKDLAYSDDQLSKDELKLLATLDEPSRTCADTVGDNITSLQIAIGICYGIDTSSIARSKSNDPPTNTIKAGIIEEGISELKTKLGSKGRERQCLLDVHDQRAKLIQSREALKAQLDWVVHNMNTAHMLHGTPRHEVDASSHSLPTSPTDPNKTSHHHQLFRKSLYATSLLHISSEIIRAMTLVISVLELHMTSRPRVFFLRPSWMWLGMSPRALVVEQTNEEPDLDPSPAKTNNEAEAEDAAGGTGLSAQEVRQGLFQRRSTALLMSPAVQANVPMPLHRRFKKWWHNLRNTSVNRRSIYRALCAIVNFPGIVLTTEWNRSGVLHFRIKLSRFVRRIQHSKHARHAVKNAFGMSLLAIPSFLPNGTPGRSYFKNFHGVWAIISFMYVLEPNTASTWRVGIMRLCGTCIGATFAFVAGEILLTWLVRSSTPGVGVVASVTIPPIIFSPYLGLDYTTVIGARLFHLHLAMTSIDMFLWS